jgi:hypothetical protein
MTIYDLFGEIQNSFFKKQHSKILMNVEGTKFIVVIGYAKKDFNDYDSFISNLYLKFRYLNYHLRMILSKKII